MHNQNNYCQKFGRNWKKIAIWSILAIPIVNLKKSIFEPSLGPLNVKKNFKIFAWLIFVQVKLKIEIWPPVGRLKSSQIYLKCFLG